jgi:hypothetical protein
MNGHICFGKELKGVLRTLPRVGPLFPKLKPMREAHRATEFDRARRWPVMFGMEAAMFRRRMVVTFLSRKRNLYKFRKYV